jgi:uncharacterized protein YndB with AHSA1/START domain
VTLPTDEQILITREFDIPKALAYRAWTTPELVRRWWCGERGTMTIAEIDLRVGGAWRYVMVTNDGDEIAFSGVYREIVPDERIVYTETLESRPEVEAHTAVTFSEVHRRTTVAVLVQYGSRRDRDAHRDYMGDGMEEALELLEQVAPSEIGTGRTESTNP